MFTTRGRRAAATFAALALAGALVVPAVAGVLSQTDYRFSFPFGIRTNNTGASLFVRQDGSGSIATFRDGATDEFTIDQSEVTSLNPLTLNSHLKFGTAAPAAVVTGTAVAPAAVLQPITMATAGTVPITVPSAGRVVCMWNTGTQGVTVADNSTQQLAGAMTLGQYDVLCGISDGTRFIEITRSNN